MDSVNQSLPWGETVAFLLQFTAIAAAFAVVSLAIIYGLALFTKVATAFASRFGVLITIVVRGIILATMALAPPIAILLLLVRSEAPTSIAIILAMAVFVGTLSISIFAATSPSTAQKTSQSDIQ